MHPHYWSLEGGLNDAAGMRQPSCHNQNISPDLGVKALKATSTIVSIQVNAVLNSGTACQLRMRRRLATWHQPLPQLERCGRGCGWRLFSAAGLPEQGAARLQAQLLQCRVKRHAGLDHK